MHMFGEKVKGVGETFVLIDFFPLGFRLSFLTSSCLLCHIQDFLWH